MNIIESNKGAVLVEFVLIFFMISLILFTIVDFGLLLNHKFILSSAAREGGRLAAVEGGATDKVYERIKVQLEMGGINHQNVEIQINPKKAGYGSAIEINLSFEHSFITPVVRKFTNNDTVINASFVTRSENVK